MTIIPTAPIHTERLRVVLGGAESTGSNGGLTLGHAVLAAEYQP
jgi:hypothetical protein